ncbi:PilZ domain-containing protein [Bradyrhizobium sp. LCT2]|uniref:PilZ domain-containing protein n=1 Tax=Bradyrhizobium sp. LCT2 TaxID=2493093 RepID=UPI00137455F9|nr:PilZ domain-containing protein [Bradyrhizobium sp. LCT2]QHP69554.1 PilZ domain-containing protein [Bradyrhizobium sp. LCT2]
MILNLEGRNVSVEWKGVERRRVTRKTVNQTVMISLLGGATVTPCAMRNLSVLGAGILLEETPIPPTHFDLSFDEFRTSFACRVVWRRDAFAGVEFVH